MAVLREIAPSQPRHSMTDSVAVRALGQAPWMGGVADPVKKTTGRKKSIASQQPRFTLALGMLSACITKCLWHTHAQSIRLERTLPQF